MDHRQQIARLVHDPVAVAALVERVRRAVEERDVRAVDALDEVDSALAVLLPVVGVRLEHESDALLLEEGQQLVHRPPEHPLAGRRLTRVAVELGVHRVDAEVGRDLDGARPVAHRRLPVVLVRSRPAEERQHRRDPDAGRGQRLAEGGDARVVDPRMVEERDEVVARRELDPLVAEIGHERRQLEQRRLTEHVGVESELHDTDSEFVLAVEGVPVGVKSGRWVALWSTYSP